MCDHLIIIKSVAEHTSHPIIGITQRKAKSMLGHRPFIRPDQRYTKHSANSVIAGADVSLVSIYYTVDARGAICIDCPSIRQSESLSVWTDVWTTVASFGHRRNVYAVAVVCA